MTTYRERLLAGEHDAPKPDTAAAKKQAAKSTSTAKKSSTKK